MANIKPFKAWRYHSRFNDSIHNLTSPLFDVVSERYRQILYQNPLNSIHLSVPNSESVGKAAAVTFEKWKQENIVVQDEKPAIYVYYQHFSLNNDRKKYCRKGFIAFVKAYDWDERVVLRHENTIPKAVNDRLDILEQCQINASPTHGLYKDEGFELEKYMDESMKSPIYEIEDYQGVRDVLAVIDDEEIIKKFVKKLATQQVILADGHHRYSGSVAYRQKRKKENPNHTENEGYNYHMMFLTNSESDDLRILPTHRLIYDLPNFDEKEVLEKVAKYFTIGEIETSNDLFQIITGKKWTFGLVLSDKTYKIHLNNKQIEKLKWDLPMEVKELEPTVLHYFVIEKVLGIEGKDQRSSPHISFERNFTECMTEVFKQKAQMALIMNEVPIETVYEVCQTGYTMPQKSTYFYPKAIAGFLFGSIK